MRKFSSLLVLLLIVAGALFFYFRFYFVFGEGVKSGELNYVVRKVCLQSHRVVAITLPADIATKGCVHLQPL